MKQLILVICLGISVTVFSQNRSNIWELSYSTDLMYPNCEIAFSSNNADTQSVARIMSMLVTNNSICDTNGNLLFYTNGLTMGNKNYDTLHNAVNFNPGFSTDNYEPIGMGISQGALILPMPGNYQLYYIFYVTAEPIFAYGNDDTNPLYLSYSIVDMNLDNGLGGIDGMQKNLHAIEDTLVLGRLTACKHANGRDWWVISHEYYTDVYYKLLVTPDGIQGPFIQKIGSMLLWNDIFGQTAFSPDGSKFAMMNASNNLDYMEFNRCTGEFINEQSFVIPDNQGTYGCSFSPNSRFLYTSSKYHLYQYDTWNPNMVNDVIHIAEWDSFYSQNVQVLFFMHQLGPDNRIYISTFNGSKYQNIINQPDSLGIACDFEPHSFVLPQYNVNVPSFPNYDLGALEGSPCDTLYISNTSHQTITNFRISPNPAGQWMNIVYNTDIDALLTLYDVNGKVVTSIRLFHYFKNRLLDVSNLQEGVYFATVVSNNKVVRTEKVVVVH